MVDYDIILAHESNLMEEPHISPMSIPCPTSCHQVDEPPWRDRQNHLLEDQTNQRADSPLNKPVIFVTPPIQVTMIKGNIPVDITV